MQNAHGSWSYYFDTGGFDRLNESGGTVASGSAVVVGNDDAVDSVIDINNNGNYDDAGDVSRNALSLTSIGTSFALVINSPGTLPNTSNKSCLIK